MASPGCAPIRPSTEVTFTIVPRAAFRAGKTAWVAKKVVFSGSENPASQQSTLASPIREVASIPVTVTSTSTPPNAATAAHTGAANRSTPALR